MCGLVRVPLHKAIWGQSRDFMDVSIYLGNVRWHVKSTHQVGLKVVKALIAWLVLGLLVSLRLVPTVLTVHRSVHLRVP